MLFFVPLLLVTAGKWVGIVTYADLKVPFAMDLQFNGDKATGAFFNGDQRAASTSGTWVDGELQLEFSQYGKKLVAKVVDGRLQGKYAGYDIEAEPYCTCAYEGEAGTFSGEWKIEGTGWKLVVARKGEDTYATINDAVHSGRFDGLQFTLNHFDGERASVIEATVRKDGRLDLVYKQPGSEPKKLSAVLIH